MKAQEEEYLIDFKRLRERSGLTQVQVAEAVGVSQHTVSGWDRGAQPLAKHLPRMAKLFRCSIEELYGLPRP